MSPLQEYMEPCQLIEKTRKPDGEGGFITAWTDGAEGSALGFDKYGYKAAASVESLGESISNAFNSSLEGMGLPPSFTAGLTGKTTWFCGNS